MRVVVATYNAGKLREFEPLLATVAGLELVGARTLAHAPRVVEDGASFEDNAIKKARAFAIATGELALADDSGLEVDALDGAPGVRSARYAGESATDVENNQKLLGELDGIEASQRTARFRCVLALVEPARGDVLHIAQGTCEGRIVAEPRGTHGFGYDPLFVARGETRTMAELPPAEKNRLSHRARAVRSMRDFLRSLCRVHDRFEG